MEFLKKLFNFSDTISGTDFIIRWVAAFIIQWPGGYLTGMGLAENNMGVAMLGFMLATLGIAFQFSTLMKRSRALFAPNNRNVLYFYCVYLVVSIFQGFTSMINPAVQIITSLVMLGLFGYAIFKNSGIAPDNHLG